MNHFDTALAIVLAKEGGYVNDPRDNGGETNLGISSRAHPDADLKRLTPDIARDIYLEEYWKPAGCDKMNWPMCLFVFDFAVNSGVGRAVRVLQKRLGLRTDGVAGPVTQRAVNRMGEEAMLRYLADRIRFMESLDDWAAFGNGWAYRVLYLASLLRGHGR